MIDKNSETVKEHLENSFELMKKKNRRFNDERGQGDGGPVEGNLQGMGLLVRQ